MSVERGRIEISAKVSAWPDRQTRGTPAAVWLQAGGDWLRRQQGSIRRLQWALLAVYYTLLFVPAILPPPAGRAAALGSLAGVAEILFWGIWWPAVILSTLLFGQFWCGVFCPDGALTEWASRRGRGGKIPAWLRWAGWPLLAFALVMFYEHLVTAQQSPRAIVVTLGGASLLALLCGLLLGRGKRIWCRYLCPAGGLFSLLARCAVLHFRVDRASWDNAPKPLPRAVDCPLLLDVRRLRGNEKCSMCGRCSGHRDAVRLAWRAPGSEIAGLADDELRAGTTWAIIGVLIGLGFGVIHGHRSFLAGWTESLLGGLFATALAILLSAGGLAAITAAALRLAAGRDRLLFRHLAHALIPLAGCELLLGAFGQSFRLLGEFGVDTSFWETMLRALLLAAGAIWSLHLGRAVRRARHPGGRLAGIIFGALVMALAGIYLLAA